MIPAIVVAWVKLLHVGTIGLWAAGLLALPFLFRQRNGLVGDELHRLHGFTRMFYVVLLSPAAFVAIGSGTVLIFFMQTYDAWFILKLAAVAVLTGIHIFAGATILKLFEPKKRYRFWRGLAGTSLTLASVTAILVLVLGKPQVLLPELTQDFFAPGALSQHVGEFIDLGR